MTAHSANVHWRGERILFGLGLALALVGCSRSGPYNPVGPSSVGPPAELAAKGGGSVDRRYIASIAPTSVGSGISTSLSMTITNCDATACPGNPTSDHQAMGSAEIVVPAGFAATQVSTPTATGGKSWSATLVSGTIRLGANQGNQKLAVGESLTVTFNVTTPTSCATYTWRTNAYQDTLSSGQLVTDTPYSLPPGVSQPQVVVTGCGSSAVCTLGLGYWKNHPTAWPVTGLTLGSVSYTAAELLAILHQPVAGNGLIQLAHPLIAAKLNIANGASGIDVAGAIAAADALIGARVVPPVGTGSLAPSQSSTLTGMLDDYNSGFFGPGACPP